MKNLKLKAMDLGAMEILTREQLKKVIGGNGSGSGSGGRCSTDRFCSMYEVRDGGCGNVGGQCRCIKYGGPNGTPSESVPDSYCIA